MRLLLDAEAATARGMDFDPVEEASRRIAPWFAAQRAAGPAPT